MSRNRSQVIRACLALIDDYPNNDWWPSTSRFEVMVGAVLVQNTRWVNVAQAIAQLKRADTLRANSIVALTPGRLQDLIKPAGCQSVKARRLTALAQWVESEGGVRKIATLGTDELRVALLAVHGIGPETADAILCFGFDRPVFIADKYARNWLRQLRFIDAKAVQNYAATRRKITAALAGSGIVMADLHAAIVQHGQASATG